MRDQSQIDDMRAAIRGDLERSRERRRPNPVVVQPQEQVEPEPPAAADEPRPSLFSSLFKRR
jgi:hypothetical protein